ncbi:MAG: hypothetical protein AB1894_04510 [Chloroflexota bacterium]
MRTRQYTSQRWTLILLSLLLLAGCSLPTFDSGREDELRQTQVALGVQQTASALADKGDPQATIAAQQATIQAAETAAAVGSTAGPDLPATQAAMAAQQTVAAGASAPTPDMIATQVAIYVQQTSIAVGGAQGGVVTPTTLALPGFSNFTDNFNDPTSGWPVQTAGPNQWYYANDHFYLSVGNPDTQVVVTSGYNLGDGVVMAQVALAQEQPTSYYGVVCRFQDINNYYFFEIAFDGYYRIGKVWNGQMSLIVNPSLNSPAIDGRPGAYNQVAGHCRGNELSLFVNDIFVDKGYDNTFSAGQVGLSASTGSFPGLVAAFDYVFAEE